MYTNPWTRRTGKNPSNPYKTYPGYKEDSTKRFFTRVSRTERRNVGKGMGIEGRD